MNRCPDHTDWVLYAAGELDEPRRTALAAHLDGCDACRAEVATLARGLTALDALEREPAMRPEAFETFRRRLGVAAAHAARPRARSIVYRYGWLAAAAVLVAAAVVYSLLPPTPTTVPTPVRHQWLDEDQFVSELAEITAGVEILEIGDYTVAADNGVGTDTGPADTPAGQSRRPVADEPVRLAFVG